MALQDLTPQLRTRLNRVEWYVGLFLGLTALLILGAFAFFLKHTADARGWFVTEVPYYTYLPNADGIRVGTPVNMMGFKIGEVTAVTALDFVSRNSWDYYMTNNFNVFVSFTVRDPFPGYITTGSRVRVGGIPIDLAGGVVLEVTSGQPGEISTVTNLDTRHPAVLWEKFAYADPGPSRTNDLLRYGALTNGNQGYYLQLDAGDSIMGRVDRILARVESLTGTLDAALPPMTEELNGSLATLRAALPGLTNEVQLLLTTARETLPGLTNGLQEVLGNTRDLTARLNDAVPVITNAVGEALVTSKLLATSVQEAIPTLTSNVNVTLTNVNVLLTRDTNITANTSTLVSNVNQVLTRHWLFRGAFKDKKKESR